MNREEHIFTHLDDHIIAFFGTALAIKKKEVFKVAFHGFLRKRKYVCCCPARVTILSNDLLIVRFAINLWALGRAAPPLFLSTLVVNWKVLLLVGSHSKWR